MLWNIPRKTGPACTFGGLSVGSLVQPLGSQGGFTSTLPHPLYWSPDPGDPILRPGKQVSPKGTSGSSAVPGTCFGPEAACPPISTVQNGKGDPGKAE